MYLEILSRARYIIYYFISAYQRRCTHGVNNPTVIAEIKSRARQTREGVRVIVKATKRREPATPAAATEREKTKKKKRIEIRKRKERERENGEARTRNGKSGIEKGKRSKRSDENLISPVLEEAASGHYDGVTAFSLLLYFDLSYSSRLVPSLSRSLRRYPAPSSSRYAGNTPTATIYEITVTRTR